MRLHKGKPNNIRHQREAGKTGERGFTLIETSVALIILMVAGLAVASLFLYAINYNSGAYDRTLALSVAQQRMERLRKGPFSDIASSNDTGVSSAGRLFNIETTVSGTTTLKNIRVSVTPQSAGAGWVRSAVVVVSQRADTGTGAYYQ